jgi:hypothetical protein
MGGFANNAPIVTDGLVFYVDAGNDNSYPGSGTTWSDLVGGNNGTLTNGPTFDSGNGGSIVFDGVNDYVDCGTISNLNNVSSFSFSLWFKSTQNSQYIGIFGEITSPRYTLELHSGVMRWWVNSSTKDTSNTYNDGNWHNFVVTQTGTSYIGYADGVEVINTTQNSITLGVTDFYIGSWGNLNYTYNGNISNLSIYNKVLSASEVLQNYNALKNRFV